MFPVAVAACIFYVVGFPLLVVYAIFSIRRNKTNSSQFSIFGSLYVRYDHSWYWWELEVRAKESFFVITLMIWLYFTGPPVPITARMHSTPQIR
eukprot:226553-Prorocentrum_minimum.AAC.1